MPLALIERKFIIHSYHSSIVLRYISLCCKTLAGKKREIFIKLYNIASKRHCFGEPMGYIGEPEHTPMRLNFACAKYTNANKVGDPDGARTHDLQRDRLAF